ncbi:MAG: MOP flippase family protein [Chitinophagaceae bacterium]|nr:MOP flippase family protein [Chitinophagaceae bacterium]
MADQILRQIVSLVISGILSRLVTPAEYGLLGMVIVATGFFQVFKDVGLGASIVQKQGITDGEKSTIFWLNVAIGVTLSVILLIASPFIARFFNQPALIALISVMALNFLFTSFLIVPDALIQKAMNFKGYFFLNLIATVLGGALGIWMAFNGAGVWALVAQIICSSFITLLLSFNISKWRPSFVFDKSLLKDHLKFSMPILADNSINYWVRNLDKILVGRVLGASILGIYTRAYSLMLMPLSQISNTLNRVMFPSFSLIQYNKKAVWDQFIKMNGIIAFICFPMMALLGIFSREIISVIYGSLWLDVVPVFTILCLLGAFQALASTFGPIYYATAQTRLMFKVGLVSRFLMLTGIVTGLYTGNLMGMIWGYLITSMVGFLVEVYFICKALNQNIQSFILSFFPELAVTVLCAILTATYKHFFVSKENILGVKNILKCTGGACMFGAIYLGLLYNWGSLGFITFKSNVNAWKKKGAAPDGG